MPLRAPVNELERCIEVVIAAVKKHPEALTKIERLRIETLLVRLLNVIVAAEKDFPATGQSSHDDTESPGLFPS
jgi:hypothetical protein